MIISPTTVNNSIIMKLQQALLPEKMAPMKWWGRLLVENEFKITKKSNQLVRVGRYYTG